MSTTKARDVQVFLIGEDTRVVRSRTWDRLKFEVEYSLQRGTTANSYLIQAERTAIIDPPGESFTQNYLECLQERLDLTQLNYAILGHFNANRGATVKALLDIAPQIKFVCSNPATLALREFFPEQSLNIFTVKNEETLDLGKGHQLQFIPAPTPRWPDGLLTYDPRTQILFSDKFFGAHVCGDQVFDEGWSVYSEDRRFYYDCLHAAQPKKVLSILDKIGDFCAHHRHLGRQFQDIPHQAAVVRFGVADDEIVDVGRVDESLEGVEVQVAKLGVGRVNQGGFFPPNDEGIVGRAVLQAELDVEAIAVPIERSDRRGVCGDVLHLHRQPTRFDSVSEGYHS